jgi:RHS repeat-associated protein
VPAGLPTVTYEYNLLSESTKLSTPALGSQAAHTIQYDYDPAGRKRYESTDGQQVTYGYSEAGDRKSTTWPDNYRVTYDYDVANRMTGAWEGDSSTGTKLAAYTYDSLTRRGSLTFAGQATNKIGYTYDPGNNLQTLTNTLNATTVGFSYDRTDAGKIKGATASDSFYLPQPMAVTSTTYATNNLNEYTDIGGNAAGYDLSGNLTSWIAPDGRQMYTYDAENRLRTAAVGGSSTASVTYDYDPMGRRVSKTVGTTVTKFLQDGDEEIADYDGATGTLQHRYIMGKNIDDRIADVDASGARTYYHVNHQGSVIATTDAAGNVNQRLSYDEYGVGPVDQSSIGVPFRYTGRRFDRETGLYYYRARYYSPNLGRFLQTDSVGYKDDLNLYAYVGSDPLDKTDPTGTECDKQGTTCTADTFKPNKATVDVKHETNMDTAVLAHAGDYQRPTKQGGEPTGLGTGKGNESGGGGDVTPTDSRPGETRTAQTATLTEKQVGASDALVHGHLGGTVIDEPTANHGYGDTQSLKYGVPTYTVEGRRVGVHDAPDGQLRFQMIKGVMTPKEMAKIQENLNTEQALFNK